VWGTKPDFLIAPFLVSSYQISQTLIIILLAGIQVLEVGSNFAQVRRFKHGIEIARTNVFLKGLLMAPLDRLEIRYHLEDALIKIQAQFGHVHDAASILAKDSGIA